MSSISHTHGHGHAGHAGHGHGGHGMSRAEVLAPGNVSFPAGTGKGMGMALMVIGLVAAVLAIFMGWKQMGGATFKQALAAYHLATMAVLAISLGGLFFTMAFHLTNAGWTGTLRRQFENLAAFVPWAFLLVVPTLVIELLPHETSRGADHGYLFAWMGNEAAHTSVLKAKWLYFFGPYANPGVENTNTKVFTHPGVPGAFPLFFVVRAALYGLIWTRLSMKLRSLSLEQDRTGDVGLTVKARFTSSWGMLLFALSTAFAAFDWLMSLDYAFASTMWGVYYFAGCAFTSIATATMVLAILRKSGKLQGAVTSEHFHDLAKLMFTFTVFWGYIGFSQYFLIWYSNIPEETAFYDYRAHPEWLWLGRVLIVGHFVAPFLILLFRKVKRSPGLLIVLALWAVTMEVADMYWIVRPMANTGVHGAISTGTMSVVVDMLAILGILAAFAGFLVQKVPQSNLVAINDPRMLESLEHKNYV